MMQTTDSRVRENEGSSTLEVQQTALGAEDDETGQSSQDCRLTLLHSKKNKGAGSL